MQKIKTLLLKIFGPNITSLIQGIRFVYLLKKKKTFDPEVKILNRFLSKEDVAIDIGANGADWTYYLYRIVTKTGAIYAFEADPYYARATKYAIKIMNMKNVDLIPFGLSDKIEDVPLRIKNSRGLRFAGMGYVDKSASPNDKNIIYIKLKTLDSLLPEYPRMKHTKLIKCDVEGYEIFVFRGSIELINKARPIIIMEAGNYEKHNYDGNLLYQFFKDLNYTAFALLDNNKLSKTSHNLDQKNASSVNRILIPDEKLKLYEDIFL